MGLGVLLWSLTLIGAEPGEITSRGILGVTQGGDGSAFATLCRQPRAAGIDHGCAKTGEAKDIENHLPRAVVDSVFSRVGRPDIRLQGLAALLVGLVAIGSGCAFGYLTSRRDSVREPDADGDGRKRDYTNGD